MNSENSDAQHNPTRSRKRLSDNPNAVEQSGRATDTRNQQYARIEKVAATLFATKGFRAVGVSELCSAVSLGRGALYYYINSKEDLLFGIVSTHIEALVTFGRDLLVQETHPQKRILALSRHLTEMIIANLPEMTVCFREAECLTGQRHRVVAELHRTYQNIWKEALADGAQKGFFRSLPAVAVNGILGMHFHSFLWLKADPVSSPVDLAATFADMAASIVASDAGSGFDE
jgi:AcrR family transcriptional regulator